MAGSQNPKKRRARRGPSRTSGWPLNYWPYVDYTPQIRLINSWNRMYRVESQKDSGVFYTTNMAGVRSKPRRGKKFTPLPLVEKPLGPSEIYSSTSVRDAIRSSGLINADSEDLSHRFGITENENDHKPYQNIGPSDISCSCKAGFYGFVKCTHRGFCKHVYKVINRESSTLQQLYDVRAVRLVKSGQAVQAVALREYIRDNMDSLERKQQQLSEIYRVAGVTTNGINRLIPESVGQYLGDIGYGDSQLQDYVDNAEAQVIQNTEGDGA